MLILKDQKYHFQGLFADIKMRNKILKNNDFVMEVTLPLTEVAVTTVTRTRKPVCLRIGAVYSTEPHLQNAPVKSWMQIYLVFLSYFQFIENIGVRAIN